MEELGEAKPQGGRERGTEPAGGRGVAEGLVHVGMSRELILPEPG